MATKYGPITPLTASTEILTVGAGGKYATVTLALAAASSGDVVMVAPGTYAENVTVPDGVCMHAMGPVTLGTGAGAAVTIASPSGGESARLTGPWTLSATAAISAAAGAYLNLDPQVEISGTVSGVYRVGRRWVLQSGEAIAAYVPAAGGVISDVAIGDVLSDGNSKQSALCDNSDGTARWVLKDQSINADPTANAVSSATAGYCYGSLCVHPSAIGYLLRRYRTDQYVPDPGGGNPATDYRSLQLKVDSNAIATHTTQNLAFSNHHIAHTTINTYYAAGGGGGNNLNAFFLWTITGSASASRASASLTFAPVLG